MTGAAYHVAMTLVDIVLLVAIARRPRWSTWLGASMLGGMASLVLAIVIGRVDGQLFVEGLYGHGAAFLFGGGVVLLARKQRVVGTISIVLAFLVAAVGVDAILIEPTAVVFEEYDVACPGLEAPIRVVVLADIQTDHVGDYERRVLERARSLKPDLLLFTGDYIHASSDQWLTQVERLNRLLKDVDFRPPLGALAIQGNVDGGLWTSVFSDTGVRPIETTETFDLGPLIVTGLGLRDSFQQDLRIDRPADKPHVVLGHCPSYALGEINADLLLAGHTHGGQIRIPGFGAILTLSPGLPRSWASGATRLPSGGVLIVSRGIGMERGRAPRVRFFCPPEVSVITLRPANAISNTRTKTSS